MPRNKEQVGNKPVILGTEFGGSDLNLGDVPGAHFGEEVGVGRPLWVGVATITGKIYSTKKVASR